jgi:hypothetical protein
MRPRFPYLVRELINGAKVGNKLVAAVRVVLKVAEIPKNKAHRERPGGCREKRNNLIREGV